MPTANPFRSQCSMFSLHKPSRHRSSKRRRIPVRTPKHRPQSWYASILNSLACQQALARLCPYLHIDFVEYQMKCSMGRRYTIRSNRLGRCIRQGVAKDVMAELDTGDLGEREILMNFILRGPEKPTTCAVKGQHTLAVEKG